MNCLLFHSDNAFLLLSTSIDFTLFYLDKSGCPPEQCVDLINHILNNCNGLEFSGIMTIGAVARSVQQGNTNEDFKVCLMYFYNVVYCS